MKRVIAICLMCALSSCATTDTKDSAKMSQIKQNSSGYDEAYMARVERQASQNGVIIKWVSPPRAQKVKKDGQ